jgi:hypothetical protein
MTQAGGSFVPNYNATQHFGRLVEIKLTRRRWSERDTVLFPDTFPTQESAFQAALEAGRRKIGRATVYASSLTVLDALKGNPTFEAQLAKARQSKAEMELKRKP